MKTMQRTVMAAVVAVFVSAGVTALASRNIKNQSPDNFGTIQLTNTGEEPAASGEATLRNVRSSVYVNYLFPYPVVEWYYEGKLVVKCQNLIPGATYSTPVGTFTANWKGAGSITGEVGWVADYSFAGFGGYVEVVRLDGDGSSTEVLFGWINS